MLVDIGDRASKLAVGIEMCEDKCPNATALLASHRLVRDIVVDHSTAPNPEAG
jgi:hypothetical protein